jgi:oligo-1,6-glucosidase
MYRYSQHARTPMQWDTTPNAGFTSQGTKPWMRVMPDFHHGINASSQMNHPPSNDLSTWQFWQRAIQDRKTHAPVFVYGDYTEVSPEDEDILAYERTSETGERWIVVLNFSGKHVEWNVPGSVGIETWVRGTYTEGKQEKACTGRIPLRPWEGILGKCVAL